MQEQYNPNSHRATDFVGAGLATKPPAPILPAPIPQSAQKTTNYLQADHDYSYSHAESSEPSKFQFPRAHCPPAGGAAKDCGLGNDDMVVPDDEWFPQEWYCPPLEKEVTKLYQSLEAIHGFDLTWEELHDGFESRGFGMYKDKPKKRRWWVKCLRCGLWCNMRY